MLKSIVVSGLAALLVACGPTPDLSERLLSEKGHPSVFRLTPPSIPEHGGTGFLLETPSGSRYTITNHHVCEIAENGKLRVHYHNGLEEDIRVLRISDDTDLCLLTPASKAEPLKMADNVRPYQHINVIGHPLLRPLSISSGNLVNRGIVQVIFAIEPAPGKCDGPKFNRAYMNTFFGPVSVCLMIVEAYDTTVITYPGNSGSPAVDDNGDVVGVLFAGNNRTNWGLIVPLDSLKEFVKYL